MNATLKRIVSCATFRTAMHRATSLLLPLCLLVGGCINLKPQPIEVKPIHITMDVNVNVKVEKALEDFFGDLDKKMIAAKP